MKLEFTYHMKWRRYKCNGGRGKQHVTTEEEIVGAKNDRDAIKKTRQFMESWLQLHPDKWIELLAIFRKEVRQIL